MSGLAQHRKRFGAAVKRSRLPAAEADSEADSILLKNELKDVLTIKDMRFNQWIDTDMIKKKMSRRDPQWIEDVIMGRIHGTIL